MREKINIQKRITLFIIILLILCVGFIAISRYENRLTAEKNALVEISHRNNTSNDDLIGGSGDVMQISVFFQNPKLANDPNLIECGRVFPVLRKVERVPGVAHQALQELIIGPTESERGDGYISAIPKEIGLHINSVNLENGILTIEFNRPPFMGGSCAL
ncbi:hypothetical protein C4565_07405, partial [Candidatus Parcubacteria bacterium]